MDSGYFATREPSAGEGGSAWQRCQGPFIYESSLTGRYAVSLFFVREDGSMGEEFATFSSEGEAEDHKARFCARHRNYRKKLKRNKGGKAGEAARDGEEDSKARAKHKKRRDEMPLAPGVTAPAAAATAADGSYQQGTHTEGTRSLQGVSNSPDKAPTTPATQQPGSAPAAHPAAAALVPPRAGDQFYWWFDDDKDGKRYCSPQLLEALGLEEEPAALEVNVLRILGSGATAWVVAAEVLVWVKRATRDAAAAAGQELPPRRSCEMAVKIFRLHAEMDPWLRPHPEDKHDKHANTWLDQEWEVLQLGGPYLPTCYARGAVINDDEVFRRALLMELVPRGSLDQVIKSNPQSTGLPRGDIRRYIRHMVEGLALLHRHGFIYRDLKPHNALLHASTDGRTTVKLVDFSTSRQLQSLVAMTKGVGTCDYMAPELVRGDPYDSKADIWALGPTLLYLLKGREPWYFLRPNQQGKRGKFSTLRETWCPYIKNDAQGEALGPEEMSFMREVMKEDPKARPTAEWLLANSSYLQGAG